jgi:hypothetical protein
MRHPRPSLILLVALLVVSLSGCVQVRDRYEDAVGSVGGLSDQVRFCLSLTRALNGVESASPDIAEDAIEEAVMQSPDDLLDDVRSLANRIRSARETGSGALRDPDLVSDAQALRSRAGDICDPT